MKPGSDLLARLLFGVACLLLAYIIGAATVHYRVFPYPQIREAVTGLKYEATRLHWSLFRYDTDVPSVVHDASSVHPGLTLVSGFTDGLDHNIRVVDESGNVVHQWLFDPTAFWPELSRSEIAGWDKHVHGTRVLDNGDLLVNYSEHALFRLSPCGDVIWRMDELAHHAIDVDEDGNIWVPGEIHRTEPVDYLPNHRPWFMEFTLFKLSPSGEVLKEISVNKLLADNGLQGLLYLSTIQDLNTVVWGDTLHLNDVEVFPGSLEEGVFRHGDIMISLRNINTVLVFDPETLEIRWIVSGRTVRQHDPDFVDGNRITVFDNNNLLSDYFDNASGERASQGIRSRIAMIDARDNSIATIYGASEGQAFFTDIMGNHQVLPNGNILISEARAGRSFEVTRDGRTVWEYFNIIEPGILGAVDDSARLPPFMDNAFFADKSRACG